MKRRTFIIRTIVCLLALSLLLTACGNPDQTTGSGNETTNGPTSTVAPTKPTDPLVPSTNPEPTVAPTDPTDPTEPADPTEPTDPTDPTEPDVKGYYISMGENVGASIECGTNLNEPIKAGTVINFTLKISAFYEGTAEVYAGEKKLIADKTGLYSFEVQADTTISIKGLTRKTSNMSGSGTSDEPFVITSPVDMLYIAEMVNKGDATYCNAYYKLNNDLDCEGEQLYTIGDGSIDAAVFSGYFQGNGKTISNFTINSTSSPYVGLFGVLYADTTGYVTGGGSIVDLHLKDFTIEAAVSGQSSFVGAMVGYGMGGNLLLCSAENGKINVYADGNSFAYVGGMMGIQQALDAGNYAFYSSISYCNTDVDINCYSGMTYAAGGISGYVAASTNGVPAYINNCYTNGDVYGAMRAGGIAGYMASATSVVNSYATGVISAQTTADDAVNSPDFCYAYAGGLVGYAEANSVIAESFSTSQVQAIASLGSAYEVTGGTLAWAGEVEEYDFGYNPATVYNCAHGNKNEMIGSYAKDNLHWIKHDWIFDDGDYPKFNLNDTDESLNYSFKVTIKVDENETVYEGMSYLMPLHFWYTYVDEKGALAGLPSRLPAGDNSTRISYGYYFDEALTMPVPESYIPSYDITLYAGVADVADVIGEYDLVVDGSDDTIRLTLHANGTFTYSDAGQTAMSGYIYNGETIIFQNARFARYFSGQLGLEHYQYYNFCATIKEDGRLEIIGGVYDDGVSYDETVFFTAEKPLVAIPVKTAMSGSYFDGTGIYIFNADGTGFYKTTTGFDELSYTRQGEELIIEVNGETITGTVNNSGITIGGKTLSQLDAFAGSWTVDSRANKVYTFDGAGGWSYSYYGYIGGTKTVYQRAEGSYTIDENGILTMSGDLTGTAEFVNGVLYVTVDGKSVACHQEGGFYGTWIYPDYGMTLILKGINADGQGIARIEYMYADGIVEFYDLVYALDEKDSSRICLYYMGDVFGFMNYNAKNDCLSSTIYVGPMATFMTNVNLIPVDDYLGQWIGQIQGMPTLSFDGNGKLTIGDQQISYMLENGTLNGSFFYNGTVYQIAYNEDDGSIIITYGENVAIYYHKDAYGDLTLTDGENFYTFDGRGQLSLGTLYVNGNAAYTYKVVGNELRIYAGDDQIGSITLGETEYLLELNGEDIKNLRIQTEFTDTWGRSQFPAGMVIGTMGLDGKMPGIIDTTEVIFTLEEDGSLSFELGEETIYLIKVGEDNLVMSSYKDWYLYTDYVYAYCARVDDMYGSWKNGYGAGYQFDGASNGTLTAAIALGGSFSGNGTFTSTTAYGYSYENGQWVMWTVDKSTLVTQIFRLNFCEVSEASKMTYISEDGTRAFNLETGDRLYSLEAIDPETEITYSFDGFGKVTTSEGETYEYKNVNVNNATYTATADITIDGVVYRATIDFSSEEVTITLEQK